MAEFYAGYYDGTVLSCAWIRSPKKGTLGLEVTVEVRNAQGETQEMTGCIWLTDGTMRLGKHKDGTPARSMAERQLNALGYRDTMNNAGRIGDEIDLAGQPARVQLKMEDDTLRIAFFCEKTRLPRADRNDVDAFLAGERPSWSPAPTTKEDHVDDDVPF